MRNLEQNPSQEFHGHGLVGVRENARFGRTYNYGPLGGFTTVDVSAGYRLSSYLTASAQVVTLFDTKMREFMASPFIGRLYSAELKVMLPALGAKQNLPILPKSVKAERAAHNRGRPVQLLWRG